MARKMTDTETLLDQENALRVYLDALLCEIPVDDEVVSANNDQDEARPPVHEAFGETAPQEIPQEEAGLQDFAEAAEPVQEPEEQVSSAGAKETGDEPETDATPDWAQTNFQSLSFQVSGLTLAAPLDKLNGIVELNEDLTELPGYSPWVLGVLSNRGQNVQVIDLGQIIMPKNRQTMPAARSNGPAKYIVLINSGNFGLAADSLSKVLTLSPGDVRWRGSRSKRPWLAGTVIEQMCAILDIDNLVQELNRGIRETDRA